MKYPKHLYRRDDGEKFTHKGYGIYIMDKTMMARTYEYPYELLIRNGFKKKLKDCHID